MILLKLTYYPLQFIGRQMNENDNAEAKIGHYLLGRTIGSGAYARVREAKHDLTGVRVAVKIINKPKMKNKNMISKVKRQIGILKIINHPNIIKLYEVLDTNSDIYVVMEMADRSDLCTLIENCCLTEKSTKNLFRQIINGVEAIHLKLISHRDLKPQNILIDSSNTVKIADFGLSNLLKDGKFLTTVCGSLNYAAPQVLGHRNYEGTSVDVWSCGIILYFMLFRELPFEEEVASVLIKKIQEGQFSIPENVNPLAEDLLRRMIQHNPLKRLQIREIKLHPWLRQTSPLYSSCPALSSISMAKIEGLDQQLIDKVRSYQMSSLQKNNDPDRIKRILRAKLDASFVTAYQLLRDAKQLNQRVEKDVSLVKNYLGSDERNYIFHPVCNHINKTKEKIQNPSFVFGHSFMKTPYLVITVILNAFQQMRIHYKIKNNKYCLMCSSTIKPSFSFSKNIKYDKKGGQRVAFGMQLYSKGWQTFVNLRLTQGHPLVFMSLCKHFFENLKQGLDNL